MLLLMIYLYFFHCTSVANCLKLLTDDKNEKVCLNDNVTIIILSSLLEHGWQFDECPAKLDDNPIG